MEIFFTIILPILFLFLFVVIFLFTISLECRKVYNEKLRIRSVILFAVVVIISIFYPLFLEGFYKLFTLAAIILFFVILFKEEQIKKIVFE